MLRADRPNRTPKFFSVVIYENKGRSVLEIELIPQNLAHGLLNINPNYMQVGLMFTFDPVDDRLSRKACESIITVKFKKNGLGSDEIYNIIHLIQGTFSRAQKRKSDHQPSNECAQTKQLLWLGTITQS